MDQKLIDIVDSIIGKNHVEITEETDFINDLTLDSLDYFHLITGIEDSYGITFKDRELEELETVGDVIKLIQSKTK